MSVKEGLGGELHSRSDWLKSRRLHLKQIRNMVDVRLPPESEEVKSYTESFLRSFGKNWKAIDRKQLIGELGESKVIMISDFHAHGQSQRVIRRFIEALPRQWELAIAAEFLEAKHQEIIDSFMNSEITSEEFLSKIKWDQRWGFGFKGYGEILALAKRRNIKVYGVNSYEKLETQNSMQRRDRFAAKKVSGILQQNSGAKVLVVFGELHLAKDRLPKFIREECSVKGIETSVIYQNPERIYLKLAERGLDLDLLKIGPGRFAIMGSPPWVQWQSYLIYLENKYDDGFEDEDEDESGEIDVDSLVIKYIEMLSGELQLEVDPEKIQVYTGSDDMFWNKLKKNMSSQQFRLARGLMVGNESLYIPRSKWGYLSQVSVNHVTTIAGHFLHSEVAKISRLPWELPQDFERLIWYDAVAFFMSKWINPHRKADTLNDLRGALHDSEGEAKESLLLALDQKMSEILKIRDFSRNRKIFPRRKLSYFRASRILGGMMGEKLYYGFKRGRLPDLKKWITEPIYRKSFSELYENIVIELEKINVPYSSKKERF